MDGNIPIFLKGADTYSSKPLYQTLPFTILHCLTRWLLILRGFSEISSGGAAPIHQPFTLLNGIKSFSPLNKVDSVYIVCRTRIMLYLQNEFGATVRKKKLYGELLMLNTQSILMTQTRLQIHKVCSWPMEEHS